MKNGKKLTVAERQHVEASGLNSSDWLLSKKEPHMWTLVHRYVLQTKQILAP